MKPSFVAAVALSAITRELLYGLLFGGLGAATFLTYFLSRPLRALEENLNFLTWLGVIYNSYWTRLMYAMNMETVQKDLAAITDEMLADITIYVLRLADKLGIDRRPAQKGPVGEGNEDHPKERNNDEQRHENARRRHEQGTGPVGQ